eukprot:6208567-Pleurochrysis_carterae.AAC.1
MADEPGSHHPAASSGHAALDLVVACLQPPSPRGHCCRRFACRRSARSRLRQRPQTATAHTL